MPARLLRCSDRHAVGRDLRCRRGRKNIVGESPHPGAQRVHRMIGPAAAYTFAGLRTLEAAIIGAGRVGAGRVIATGPAVFLPDLRQSIARTG